MIEMTAEYTIMLKQAWSKCSFCGASNGLFNTPLAQHRPRCLWIGNANVLDTPTPNYRTMIDEDDIIFLPAVKAAMDLPLVLIVLKNLQAKYDLLVANLEIKK